MATFTSITVFIAATAILLNQVTEVRLQEEDVTNECRVVPYVANFENFTTNFTQIVRPETFNIGACEGECPYNSTDEGYYGITSRLNGPRPCCFPTEFRPLQILISEFRPELGRFTSRIERVADAVVSACGCGPKAPDLEV